MSAPPRIVAHRGASATHPENTMAAFRAAMEQGADAIEFDLHQTADGALVVIHDYNLERTTDGHGPVHRSGSAAVQALDAGRWFADRFAGEHVPTLEAVLELDVGLELELKAPGREFLQRVVAAVVARARTADVEFTSAHLPLLLALREMLPEARIGMFSVTRPDWMSEDLYEEHVCAHARMLPFDVVHVRAPWITRALVDRLHGDGKIAHAADADGDELLERAIDAGVDQISTHDVPRARAVIARRA